MNNITYETRQLSFEDIKPKRLTRYLQILEILGNKEMTAREIETIRSKTYKPKRFDMNCVRPRLTELVNEYHELVECGIKRDEETNKTVAIYRRATEAEKWEYANSNHIPNLY